MSKGNWKKMVVGGIPRPCTLKIEYTGIRKRKGRLCDMTKKEREILQKKETELWYALCEYDYFHAPKNGNYDDEVYFDKNDQGHRERLNAWCAVFDITEALKIERLFNEEAHELHHALFIEREAARGRHYDERGNLVTEEAPTEAPEEETHEETHEEPADNIPEYIPTENEAKTGHPEEYVDMETGEALTREELWNEYYANPYADAEVTFAQWLNNCQTRNGGTLERWYN
jgi:hypothetical protein